MIWKSFVKLMAILLLLSSFYGAHWYLRMLERRYRYEELLD
jgi:hypothetical protein